MNENVNIFDLSSKFFCSSFHPDCLPVAILIVKMAVLLISSWRVNHHRPLLDKEVCQVYPALIGLPR